MTTGGLFDAQQPFAPYQGRIPPIVPGPFDAPLVTLCVNESWMTALMGSAACLMAASTWDSTDENVVRTLIGNARSIIETMMDFEACTVPIQFRVDPGYPQNWQYSLDAGITWLAGPDTASHFTPSFVADGGAPGAYDLSVNGGHTSDPIPLLTAFDPEAIIKDPASALANSILAASGVDGLVVGIAAHIGVILQSNGISAFFQKVPGLGLAADTVVALKAGADYTYPLLALLP
jgi:hypothetical protein